MCGCTSWHELTSLTLKNIFSFFRRSKINGCYVPSYLSDSLRGLAVCVGLPEFLTTLVLNNCIQLVNENLINGIKDILH